MPGTAQRYVLLPLPSCRNLARSGGPKLSRGTTRRLARSSHALDWATDGTSSLNQLFGFCTPSAEVRNAGQDAALRNIESAYLSVPPPPGDPDFRKGALDSLFAGPGLYSEESSTQRPYVKSKVSWPARGNSPTSLSDCLAQAGSRRFFARGAVPEWPHTPIRP